MEQRKFQMHEKLLRDVIMRQAGSLQKAALEGVMNSIEAGASKVEVNIGPKTMSIKDDGKGFRDRTEVEKFFETFGQPHEASEGKKWAQFRMGRGQMFAFGKNRWRTGKFCMKVDIKQTLGYDLETVAEEAKGCDIHIDLYDILNDRDIYGISREIETFCKYVSIPVVVNDKQINQDPKTAKWGKETSDEAYIKLSDTALNLMVYNMGVFVTSLSKHEYGIGGTVVSKERLDVNFARNDIIKSCPIWRRIAKVIEASAGIERIKTKKTLDADERLNVIQRLCAGELDYSYAMSAPLFVDVAGNAWTANKINKKFTRWTTAVGGDMRGDKLIQTNVAIVLNEEIVSKFDCKTQDLFSHEWMFKDGHKRTLAQYNKAMTFAEFESIAKTINTQHTILPEEKWSKTEAEWAIVAKELADYMSGWNRATHRSIKIGTSETANGWTDGVSYIAIGREFLRRLSIRKEDRPHLSSLCELGELLAHELAHDDDSTTNVHGGEFYKKFHDIVLGRRGDGFPSGAGLHYAVQRAYAFLTGKSGERVTRKAEKIAKNAVPEPLGVEVASVFEQVKDCSPSGPE